MAMSEATAQILARVDAKPASYLGAARELAAIENRDGLVDLPVAALATFTFDLLRPYITVEAARRGLDVRLTCAPYGQLEQQVLDPASELYAAAREVVVIAVRIEDVCPDLVDGFVALDAGAAAALVAQHVARIADLATAIRSRTAAHIVVWNQAPLQRVAAGLADAMLEPSQQHVVAELNAKLARACASIPSTTIFDVARVAATVGTERWFDRKLQFLARSPLAFGAQVAVATQLARHMRALVKPSCKCLVLDLDNTLWGGVLGEEGPGGIALGEEYPGSVYKAFQRALRAYRDRGVLLAIASKNNPADVAELFASHADMVLRHDDFAAQQVHWNDKATSLRAIAEELNIGVDSLAFFDDNPVERAWVREQLPDVTVIDVPTDPLRYIEALDESGAFDQLRVTAEDRARPAQYRSEHQRRELERTSSSVEDFLRALAMKVTIGRIDSATLPRVVQLLGKTNQFNITTRRHSESDLTRMLDDGGIGLWMRVSDRYGDHGLVGVALAVRDEPATYRLDTFLMSCRVLGRGAERALVHALYDRVRTAGGTSIVGEFIPTKKNAPAAGFFADAGFTPHGTPGWWRLDLDRAPELRPLFEIIVQS